MPAYRLLQPGDPAPWFRQRASGADDFAFESAAGRYSVLCFFGTAADDAARRMLSVLDERDLFGDAGIAFYGVSVDPADERESRVRAAAGVRFVWDGDGRVSALYGAVPLDAAPGPVTFKRFWLVIDPALRVRAVFPGDNDDASLGQLVRYLRSLPSIDLYAGLEVHAPVLALPGVFEPELCRRLIDLHVTRHPRGRGTSARGGELPVHDTALLTLLHYRITRRVVPEIRRVFHYTATRIDRSDVTCHDARDHGHEALHRDDATPATAHRRFAITLALNEEYEGGELTFPEYGGKRFRLPTGGALVHSCSLLHGVLPVTRGVRYAFVPVLADEPAAAAREPRSAQAQGERHAEIAPSE